MAEKMMHEAPLRCRMYVEHFGMSPSAKYIWCRIGCKLKSDKCRRCPEGYMNLDDIDEIHRRLNECCGNCKYHKLDYKTGEWKCTCKESEAYACDTTYSDVCDEWEAIA